MDWIRIHAFELDCIVGVWPHERVREQRLRLDLALGLDTRQAARSGRIAQTVRYDIVANQLAAMLHFRKYQLLEVAAEELAATLLAIHGAVECVRLRLEKPGALEGKAAAASVEIERRAADFAPSQWNESTTRGEMWLTTRSAVLGIQRLQTGASLQVDARSVRLLALVADGALISKMGRLEAGAALLEPSSGPLPSADRSPCAGASRWAAGSAGAVVFVCSELPEVNERQDV